MTDDSNSDTTTNADATNQQSARVTDTDTKGKTGSQGEDTVEVQCMVPLFVNHRAEVPADVVEAIEAGHEAGNVFKEADEAVQAMFDALAEEWDDRPEADIRTDVSVPNGNELAERYYWVDQIVGSFTNLNGGESLEVEVLLESPIGSSTTE